jgi:hypothetical protein
MALSGGKNKGRTSYRRRSWNLDGFGFPSPEAFSGGLVGESMAM